MNVVPVPSAAQYCNASMRALDDHPANGGVSSSVSFAGTPTVPAPLSVRYKKCLLFKEGKCCAPENYVHGDGFKFGTGMRQRDMLATREQQRIVSTIRDWGLLERESSESIEQVKARCSNPLVFLVMDIIENDSRLHKRLQEFIINALEHEPLTLSPDEVDELIGLIHKHARLKARMVEKVESTMEMTKDKSLGIQEFLLKTLLADEKKHKEMLEGIEKVMQGLYPYWPH
jgi:hypothetical protein